MIPIEIEDFVNLLLVMLANKKSRTDLNDKNKRIVKLPANYKQIIENILCADNNWKDIFSDLINIDEYFDDHFAWEIKLTKTLKETLIKMNKSIEYEFESDSLLITFTTEEIKEIMSRYSDEELTKPMARFVTLLTDYIYTREFQERHYDYYASSVKKMHNLWEEKINDDLVISELNRDKTKLKSSFVKMNRK